MQVLMRRTIGGLAADEGEASEVLRRIPIGAVVVTDIKDPRRRSTAYHRWFFALLNKVWLNQEYFATVDHLRHALLVRLGYVDRVKLKSGAVVLIPKSMKFSRMSREEAGKFMADAVKFMCEEVIPNMDGNALRAEIESMVNP